MSSFRTFENLWFRLRHLLFDARDAMVVGVALFSCCLVFLQYSPTLAHVSYTGPQDPRNGLGRLNTPPRPAELFTTNFRRRLLGLQNASPAAESVATRRHKNAALAALAISRTPKDLIDSLDPRDKKAKKCTGLVAINPDGSQRVISPCVESLLKGNFKNLPQRATNFFIESMNDPEKRKNMPKVAINSFLAMMEAMAKSVEAQEKQERQKAEDAATKN